MLTNVRASAVIKGPPCLLSYDKLLGSEIPILRIDVDMNAENVS